VVAPGAIVTVVLAGALAAAAAAIALVLAPSGARWRAPDIAHPDRTALSDAGWRIALRDWEALRAVIAIAALVLAGAAGAPLLLGPLAAALPSVAVRFRAQAARDRARPAVARLLGATHAALRSGLALPESLRRALAGCDDPIARRPFAHALARFDLGESLDRALRDAVPLATDRRGAAALETLALGVAERLPLERAASLVGAIAERLAYDERLDGEIRARASGARMQTYLLAALVPALALYLTATTPSLGATLGTPLGRFVLIPAAAALELAGILLSRRVVRGAIR